MDSAVERMNQAGARYLVIGGQAIRLHGLPRFSMDWDFFVPGRDLANLACIEAALDPELDVELLPLGPRGENVIQTYQTRWGVLQFHLAVPGLPSFEEAEVRSVMMPDEDGSRVRCLAPADLLSAKQATQRPQDLMDIAFLQALLRRKSSM